MPIAGRDFTKAVATKPIKTRRGRLAVAADVFWREPDRMHSLLIERADALMGCTGGSDEEAELERLTIAIEAYEAKRWPSGKTMGGKG